MVAPSLVTVTSWSGETISLSRPLGPKDDLRVEATDLAARMFFWYRGKGYFDGIDAFDSGFELLLFDDDEGSSVLVEG